MEILDFSFQLDTLCNGSAGLVSLDTQCLDLCRELSLQVGHMFGANEG